jgi:hypothetical protein
MGPETKEADSILLLPFCYQIEALFDDRDFKSRISREQLESAASHYLTEKRFEQPIWTALSQANMTVVRTLQSFSCLRNFVAD